MLKETIRVWKMGVRDMVMEIGCALKLLSHHEVVAQRTRRTHLMVAWYGGTSRDIEIVTGTGHWYRIGEALVAVRWVYLHECTGTHRDAYVFTTDLSMCPNS
jgi:hypothetical protein